MFKKTIILCAIIVSLNCSNAKAQIWTNQNANFGKPTQGWSITTVNDSVAWTFGYTLDSTIAAPDWGWTDEDLTFTRTSNGGNTWTTDTLPLGEPGSISNLSAISKQQAWISHNDYNLGLSQVIHTVDGGTTWMEDTINGANWVNAIHFFDAKNGIAMYDNDGQDFELFTTVDSGHNWAQVPAVNIPDITAADEYGTTGSYTVSGNKIWFNTYNYDRIFYSIDKGQHWNVWDKPTNARGFGHQVEADESNNLYFTFYILGDSANSYTDSFMLFRRNLTDTSWTDLTPVNNVDYISGISRIPGTPNMIMNMGNTATVFKTKVSYDKGVTWITIDTSLLKRGFVNFISPTVGYACELPSSYTNPSNYIFKYIGAAIVGLLHHTPIDLSIAVFPNPCVDYINISLCKTNDDDFLILLNDIDGKLLEKRELNHVKNVHERMDMSRYAKGMYTITVSNRKGTVSKKIIK